MVTDIAAIDLDCPVPGIVCLNNLATGTSQAERHPARPAEKFNNSHVNPAQNRSVHVRYAISG